MSKKKIPYRPLLCDSFSDNCKLFALSLNNGFKLIYLDSFHELEENNNYKVNDFSISEDSSLLVLATNNDLRIKNLKQMKKYFVL